MVAINNRINRIINSSYSKISETEAKEVLRECGILNSKYEIKSAYKNIITKESVEENGDN